MGNVEMHDLVCASEDSDGQELNFTTVQDYRSYCKHLSGEYSTYCLREVPAMLTDSVHMCERICFAFNCLTTLPDNLPYGLPHLTHLDVSYNLLSSLPDSIKLLIHLKELSLSHNKLKDLPLSLCSLCSLEKLDLSHNLIERLPEKMGEMPCLKKLNISHNLLKCLPLTFGIHKRLEVLLAFSNNCETEPPQSICEAGSEATLNYLSKLAEKKCIVRHLKSENVFPRHRGYVVKSSVPNPHSARAQYVQRQTETLNTASRIRTPLLPPVNSTKLNPGELKDSLIGLIYGAAIGDALGIATEFLTPDQCEFYYDKTHFTHRSIIHDEHRAHWKRGDWTSSVDQMLLVLDSLLHWAGVIDELEFAKRLVNWKKTGFQELGARENYVYSNTINLVLQEENYAQNPHQTAEDLVQKGRSERANGISCKETTLMPFFADSGSLPRAVVLGIPHFHDIHEVISNSVRICRATHSDERCIASSVSLTVAVSLMLQGAFSLNDPDSVNSLLFEAENKGAEYIKDPAVLEEFRKLSKCDNFESIGLSEAGKICHTFKPYAAAFCALRQQQQHDFKSVLSSVWMCGGYSSMNGCIVGSLLGCKYGFSKLPKEWVDGLLKQNRDLLNAKINALLDMMALP